LIDVFKIEKADVSHLLISNRAFKGGILRSGSLTLQGWAMRIPDAPGGAGDALRAVMCDTLVSCVSFLDGIFQVDQFGIGQECQYPPECPAWSCRKASDFSAWRWHGY